MAVKELGNPPQSPCTGRRGWKEEGWGRRRGCRQDRSGPFCALPQSLGRRSETTRLLRKEAAGQRKPSPPGASGRESPRCPRGCSRRCASPGGRRLPGPLRSRVLIVIPSPRLARGSWWCVLQVRDQWARQLVGSPSASLVLPGRRRSVPWPPRQAPLWELALDGARGSCPAASRGLLSEPGAPPPARETSPLPYERRATVGQLQWRPSHSPSTLWLASFLVCLLWWSVFTEP